VTPDKLRELARRLYNNAMQTTAEMAPTGEDVDKVHDVSVVRAALEQFVEGVDNGRVEMRNALVIARLLKRVLDVDMANDANRKGAVPAALNLVSRVDPKVHALHRAIYEMMDDLLQRSDSELRFPTQEECATQVVTAFYEEGIDKTLEEVGVKKIYERWANAGPASMGPDPRSIQSD